MKKKPYENIMRIATESIERSIKKALPSKPEKEKKRSGSKAHICLILSGKGGVGKSTIACNLGKTLAKSRNKTLVIDGDVRGSNISMMINAMHETITAKENRVTFVKLSDNLHIASILNLADMSPDTAISWKSFQSTNLIVGMIEEALEQSYDYIIIDTEASSGEILGDLIDYFEDVNHKRVSAIVVTQGTEESIGRTRRIIDFTISKKIRIAGSILNMSNLTPRYLYNFMIEDYELVHLGDIEFDIKIFSDKIDISNRSVFMKALRRLK